MTWTWRDVEQVARGLARRHPGLDPLTLSLPEVRRLALELPEFGDDADAATDPILESIQAAWYDELEG
jgi:FeS assembly protein IscX